MCGGDLDAARPQLDEALHLTSTLRVRLIVTLALEAAAGYLAARGDGPGAARLIGATDIDREGTGYVRMPADERLLARACAGAREAMGEDPWAAARAAGRSLDLEGAIREATMRSRSRPRRRSSRAREQPATPRQRLG